MRTAAAAFLLLFAVAAQAGAPAAFDPASAPKTLTWIIDIWRPVRQAETNNNAIAVKAHEAKIDALLAQFKGRALDWTMPVTQIRSTGLSLELTRQADVKYTLSLNRQVGRNQRIIDPGKADWVLTLKPGDMLRVQGTIVGAGHVSRASEPRVYVTLANITLTPVKRRQGVRDAILKGAMSAIGAPARAARCHLRAASAAR